MTVSNTTVTNTLDNTTNNSAKNNPNDNPTIYTLTNCQTILLTQTNKPINFIGTDTALASSLIYFHNKYQPQTSEQEIASNLFTDHFQHTYTYGISSKTKQDTININIMQGLNNIQTLHPWLLFYKSRGFAIPAIIKKLIKHFTNLFILEHCLNLYKSELPDHTIEAIVSDYSQDYLMSHKYGSAHHSMSQRRLFLTKTERLQCV